jgi:tetratricopeptide (TPR) repeat protein
LQQFTSALADYNRATTLDPNYAQAYHNLGAMLIKQGKLYEALPYLEKATQLGDKVAAKAATQIGELLKKTPPNFQFDQAEKQGIAAWQQAGSLEAMRQAAAHFPFIITRGFMDSVQRAIAQFPSEDRSRLDLEQRLI